MFEYANGVQAFVVTTTRGTARGIVLHGDMNRILIASATQIRHLQLQGLRVLPEDDSDPPCSNVMSCNIPLNATTRPPRTLYPDQPSLGKSRQSPTPAAAEIATAAVAETPCP